MLIGCFKKGRSPIFFPGDLRNLKTIYITKIIFKKNGVSMDDSCGMKIELNSAFPWNHGPQFENLMFTVVHYFPQITSNPIASLLRQND